jgi:hypothetical protein
VATADNSTNHDTRSFVMDHSGRSMPPLIDRRLVGRHGVVCAHCLLNVKRCEKFFFDIIVLFLKKSIVLSDEKGLLRLLSFIQGVRIL